jgi:hypothetical protein
MSAAAKGKKVWVENGSILDLSVAANENICYRMEYIVG